jgi:hypothetical protein
MDGYATSILCSIEDVKDDLGDYCMKLLMRYLDS